MRPIAPSSSSSAPLHCLSHSRTPPLRRLTGTIGAFGSGFLYALRVDFSSLRRIIWCNAACIQILFEVGAQGTHGRHHLPQIHPLLQRHLLRLSQRCCLLSSIRLGDRQGASSAAMEGMSRRPAAEDPAKAKAMLVDGYCEHPTHLNPNSLKRCSLYGVSRFPCGVGHGNFRATGRITKEKRRQSCLRHLIESQRTELYRCLQETIFRLFSAGTR
mmetsp:Transcript_18949/g.47326  ORF Transcript_18949/g.47326 Transcript_18949/m.47326 type:complete len:215 (-) Transcript_18949:3392-4036(-)